MCTLFKKLFHFSHFINSDNSIQKPIANNQFPLNQSTNSQLTNH